MKKMMTLALVVAVAGLMFVGCKKETQAPPTLPTIKTPDVPTAPAMPDAPKAPAVPVAK